MPVEPRYLPVNGQQFIDAFQVSLDGLFLSKRFLTAGM